MTIRLDETTGTLIAFENGIAESIQVPWAGKRLPDNARGTYPIQSPPLPKTERYEVYVQGVFLYRSNRPVGTRIQQMVALGVPTNLICIVDTQTGAHIHIGQKNQK